MQFNLMGHSITFEYQKSETETIRRTGVVVKNASTHKNLNVLTIRKDDGEYRSYNMDKIRKLALVRYTMGELIHA